MEAKKIQPGYEALEKMRQGIDFGGKITIRGFTVHLRPLSISEQNKVTEEAIEELENGPAGKRTSQNEASILAAKTLMLASTSDIDQTDYKITEKVIGRMTPAELEYFHKQYLDVCEAANPAIEKLSDEELDALVEAVKKNPSALQQLSRPQLCQMAAFLLPKVGV